MAGVTIESLGAHTSVSSGTTMNVSAPSGVAAGDLLVAHIVSVSGANNTPGGWTLTQTATSGLTASVFYKIAEAGDVGLGTFPFSFISSTGHAGRIFRISGADSSIPVTTSAFGTSGNDSTLFFSGITPTVTNSMIMVFGSWFADAATRSVSSYSLDTSSPTFTERYDEQFDANEAQMCCATAIRPETTSTGNVYMVASGADPCGGIVLAVSPALPRLRSVTVPTWGTVSNGGSLTITKPTGLTVGDILLAHLTNVVGGSNNADGWSTPSGWTSLTATNVDTNSNSSVRMDVFRKTATSDDVAASNFSFVKSGSQGTTVSGALYAIRDTAGVTLTVAGASDTTTPSFANTITPTTNSLLMFLLSVADAAQTTGSVSAYAVTTNNPTWTEAYDVVGNVGAHRGISAGATASRLEATATGNSTCTTVNFSQNLIGAMVAFSSLTNAFVVPSLLTTTLTPIQPTVSGANNVTVGSTLSLTSNVNAPTVTMPSPTWTNEAKPSASVITNESKP